MSARPICLASLLLLVVGCAGPDLRLLEDRYGRATGSDEVAVTFLGCTTLLFDDGETVLMTDGFFTRPGLLTVLLDRKIAPDAEIVAGALRRAGVERLAAILPVHSHYDHALDTPEVARQTGAVVLGSETTANIARGQGLGEDRIVVVEPGRPYPFGLFTVTLYESAHAPLSDGGPPFPGTIDTPLRVPAKVSAFREGRSYSILVQHPSGSALVQGSAGFVADRLAGVEADIVYLGIGGLAALEEERPGYIRDYWKQVVTATGARAIRPIHHDDFTEPFGSHAGFPAFAEDIEAGLEAVSVLAGSSGVRLDMLPLLEPVGMVGQR